MKPETVATIALISFGVTAVVCAFLLARMLFG